MPEMEKHQIFLANLSGTGYKNMGTVQPMPGLETKIP